MQLFKLILAFAPWIAFLIIAHGDLYRLKIGLAVALVLSVVMGLLRLHRGVVLWVGLAFFSYASFAVFFYENNWTIRHMGILASGALALGAWLTVALKKPFTLDYAKEHTDPALWDNPEFIRSNMLITSLWAGVFTVNAALAYGKMNRFVLPEWGYETASYSLMLGLAFFTNWYPAKLKRDRAER